MDLKLARRVAENFINSNCFYVANSDYIYCVYTDLGYFYVNKFNEIDFNLYRFSTFIELVDFLKKEAITTL